jgi:hypothetical protein
MEMCPYQLISYIAPAAPATRRPAEGILPYLRPEVGVTPNWYRTHLGIDLGEHWHRDLGYRRQTVVAMRKDLRERFPGSPIAGIDQPDHPLDLLTGLFGGCMVAAIYGVPIIYAQDQWPSCAPRFLTDEEFEKIEPPDLDHNLAFSELMTQVEGIEQQEGTVKGFINWQGILNNAQRLRGQQIFLDLIESPERCQRLFECIFTTLIDATRRLRKRQLSSGVDYRFLTISNCLVNLVSPKQYRELLAPFDRRIAESTECLGVHNCAWRADPYLSDYADLPKVGYIDMGMDSDLGRAKTLFPMARRAIMYTPMDVANKTLSEIGVDLERIAAEYGPCDMVFADIDVGTPDSKVRAILDRCACISASYQ